MDIKNIELLINYLRIIKNALDVMIFDIKNDVIEYTTSKEDSNDYVVSKISKEWNDFVDYREENK